MHPTLLLALATAAIHFFATLIIDRFRRWQAARRIMKEHGCRSPPQEKPWDLLGAHGVVDVARHIVNGTLLRRSVDLFQKHGETYASRLVGQRIIFTCNPQNIRQVLITRFADFDSSKGLRDHLFQPIAARGIFALDGAEWKTARGLFRDLFSHTRLLFDVDFQELKFQQLKVHIPSDQAVDLQPLFLRLMMDLTTAFAMGEPADALCLDQSPSKKRFVDSLLLVKETMARDGFLGPARYLLGRRKFYEACGDVHNHVEGIIRERLRAKEKLLLDPMLQGATTREPKCLLNRLIESSTDVIDLRDGVITILIAGIDSVASLLSTTFFLLARDERVFTKLRQSVLGTIGMETPTFDTLRSLSYLRNVFYESKLSVTPAFLRLSAQKTRWGSPNIKYPAMRVYPTVPLNARNANTDTYLPAGGGPDGKSSVFVAKGQKVVFSTWGSHRNPKNFGDDAHDFRPERWENMQGDTTGYIPFNLGPRACPGQHYALMEASYVTVRLLQTFSRVESRDERSWTEHLGLGLSNKNGTVVALSCGPEAA